MSVADREDDQVSVHLTDCDREAAGAVFAVLEAAFPDPEAPARPTEQAPGAAAATVWSRTVNVGHRSGRGASAAGSGSGATAALHGAADPVRQVREELERVFEAEHLGTVPGEHELEVRVRLTARAGS